MAKTTAELLFNSMFENTRTFTPFAGTTATAHDLMGFNYGYDGRRYEYLYMGNGVFVSTKNVANRTHLTFEGKDYRFVMYRPVADQIRGVVNIYYVAELEGLATAWEPKAKPYKGKARVDNGDGKRHFMETISGFSKHAKDQTDQAEAERQFAEYGLTKFYLPKTYPGDQDKFINKGVSIIIGRVELPGLISYHGGKTMSGQKCTAHGSVRLFSKKTFDGTLWEEC